VELSHQNFHLLFHAVLKTSPTSTLETERGTMETAARNSNPGGNHEKKAQRRGSAGGEDDH
jgi:hypothetical protein